MNTQNANTTFYEVTPEMERKFNEAILEILWT